MTEYVVRFLVGGVVVSALAMLGDLLRPKALPACSEPPGLDSRDQARRLSPDRPARAAVHPQRPRLDRTLPLIVEAALKTEHLHS
jgi:hypothetical protein